MKPTAALKNAIARFRRVVIDDGQDLLEYALLVALIAVVAYGAVQVTGTRVDALFDTIATKLAAAVS